VRVYSIVLLFMMVTFGIAGQRPSTGSLEMKLSSSGKPLEKRTVQLRFENSYGLGSPFQTQLTTDNSGFARMNLYPGSYRIHLEAKEVDEYSFDATVKEGETSTVEVPLEPVEEIEFVRLPKEQIAKMQEACHRSEFWDVKVPYSFDNEQQWADSWSAFKLAAPEVDFKKWRVLAWVSLSNYVQAQRWVRRVTYNPKNKVIRARLNQIPRSEISLPAFSCVAEFVLIPARAGHVQFR
jgi:hypothetical protein